MTIRTVRCRKCGGGGFSGYGTGYDDVCSDCGGCGETPEHFWTAEDEALWHKENDVRGTSGVSTESIDR
jgi:hypothetical protein